MPDTNAEAGLVGILPTEALVANPIGMRSTPWKHQEHAMALIEARPATYLAWEMGAGKTLPIVFHVAAFQPAVTLITCPKAVVEVWPREFDKHLGEGHGVMVETLTQRTTSERIADRLARARWFVERGEKTGQPAVLVCNYDAIWRNPLGEWILKNAHLFDLVVCDEAHRIKSPGGKASRFFGRLALKMRPDARRVALSGTPMPHSPLDIYAQMRFLDPDMFGVSFVRFRNTYMRMGGYMVNNVGTKWMGFLGEGAELEFNEKIGRVMHQVKKSEVLDLPETVHVERYVQLDAKARKVYESLKADFIAEVENGVVTAANAMVKILRLGQMASGYVTTEDGNSVHVSPAKTDLLLDLLEDAGDQPIVVFARFRRDIDCIRAACMTLKRPVYELSGRQDDINGKWEPAERNAVAAVQIQSGSEGIDLTVASICIYFSPTFDNGKYQQSLARVHRPGQKQNVTFIHLLAEHTVDVTTFKALQQRQNVVEGVLAALRNHEE